MSPVANMRASDLFLAFPLAVSHSTTVAPEEKKKVGNEKNVAGIDPKKMKVLFCL